MSNDSQQVAPAAKRLFREGEACKNLGRWQEAIASYGMAIAAEPTYVDAYCNRGNAFQHVQLWDEALSCYEKALRISPNSAVLHSNRGVVLKELGRLDEALIDFDRALELKPGYATALFNRATLLLLQGDLVRGFADYEWRWEDKNGSISKQKRAFKEPAWGGIESLRGQSILLYGEQGFGDVLQFCRYAASVAALGARVVLEVRAPLANLLADLPGIFQLIPQGKPLPVCDFQLPLMSAPRVFNTTLETIPMAGRYVTGDQSKIEEWQMRLGTKRCPRVGLAWSGNIEHARDRQRSLALEELVSVLPAGIQYVSLQKDVRDSDLGFLRANRELLSFADELSDFSDTAALCECMDLVVSVDTSIAHLGGALGRPTWVLLPFHPDWRWLLNRTDSPWYSSVALYRQERRGMWHEPLRRMALDLARRFHLRS